MKSRTKQVLALIIGILLVLILGGSVKAATFQSRLLNTTISDDVQNQTYRNALEKMTRTYGASSGDTQTWNYQSLARDPNAYCIESDTSIPANANVTYHLVESGTIGDPSIAYLLANGSGASSDGQLYTNPTQAALWETSINNGGPIENAADGTEQLTVANAYGEYSHARSANGNASFDNNLVATFQGNKSGPYRIYYTYGGNDAWGGISSIQIKDQNGSVINQTNYSLVDAEGNTIGKPSSGQMFYVQFENLDGIQKATIYATFTDTETIVDYEIWEGTYTRPAREAGTSRCQEYRDIQNQINNCKNQVEIYREYQTACDGSCGKTKTVKFVYESHDDDPSKDKYRYITLRCGQHTGQLEYKIYAFGRVVYTGTTSYDYYCGGTMTVTDVEYRTCSASLRCDECRARQRQLANHPSHYVQNTRYDKQGNVISGGFYCGTAYDARDAQPNTASQRIMKVIPRTNHTSYTISKDMVLSTVDISLRKFITAINGVAVTDRIPQVDVTALAAGTDTTATYNHTKNEVTVGIGDQVTYTIRVYNEGTLDGYAAEIKDYLPPHLEYVSSTVDGVNYNWTVTTENGKQVITTDYLKNEKLEKFTSYSATGTPSHREALDYRDVKVICKVKDTAEYNEKLVNIAEISKYAYEDEKGDRIETTKDIDSTQNNINLPTDSNWPNYNGKDGNPTSGNGYWKGQEDDDDFERLVIKLTDIGGTVWLDCVEGKQEDRDNILTERDVRLEGIRVILYEKQADGSYVVNEETTTNSNGEYLFKNKSMAKNYRVAFEYQGQQYMPVEATKFSSGNYAENKSAGEETLEDRTALNNKFFEIKKDTARNQNGENTVALSYERDESKHTSTVIRNDAFVAQSKIMAYTEDFSAGASYVHYINLGIYERAQVNLGLMLDVKDVNLTINGFETTYNYEERDEKTAIDLDAKGADFARVYNQAIYQSDYNFRIEDYNQEGTVTIADQAKELQAYITYKTLVKNYSAKPAQVSELTMYYDPSYILVSARYQKGEQTGDVTWNTGNATNGYTTVRTNSVKDVTIGANEELYVYTTFQVAKDASRGIILGDKYIISEITGYTTQEGLIDKNSEPGNLSIENWDQYVRTYEDDSDRAPGLNLRLSDTGRILSGHTWEDFATLTDSDGVKIGNGTQEAGENNVNGVRVQLIEKVFMNDTTYEYIWQEAQTGSSSVKYMDRNGKLHAHDAKEVGAVGSGAYKFTEIIPGNYIVRFIYGDTEVDYAIYNGQNYKSTTMTGVGVNLSSAKDNKARRNTLLTGAKDQTNEIAERLTSNSDKSQWMNADTNEFTINLKDTTYSDYNFGMVKRPASKLVANKIIQGIKISNKNIVYVDTANGINPGVLKIADNYYHIELDDELINGAQLEVSYAISVKNEGETDTLYNYFEGDTTYGTNQHTVLKTGANLVYDYPMNLGYDDIDGDSWTITGVDTSILSEAARKAIANGAKVIQSNGFNRLLAPGESTEALTITFSKIMASGGSDDLDYINRAEIVSRRSEAGRRDEESVPGNYVSGDKTNVEPDTANAELIVTDATGGGTRVNYVLWVAVAMVLGLGVFVIKKFAIDAK